MPLEGLWRDVAVGGPAFSLINGHRIFWGGRGDRESRGEGWPALDLVGKFAWLMALSAHFDVMCDVSHFGNGAPLSGIWRNPLNAYQCATGTISLDGKRRGDLPRDTNQR